ncbi:MAG TPA: arginine N-succinyltransferase [Miltoncostaeales bacterium]|nr:arginine N-succinyltransferase [Miltoncostaeales bacterium]
MSIPRLRAARLGDLDAIVELARTAGAGLTTLPPDRAFLAERIERSESAFGRRPSHPGAEEYLFVVDDGGRIVGSSALLARVGGFDPFYTYEIRSERITHPPLGVDRTLDVLHLKRDHKGPSELCGLVVTPDRRGTGIGWLASVGRFMFVAAFPERFAERMIAEIRGFQDADGRSPFWDGVASQFFAPNAFAEMDTLSGLGEKDFIADLMPAHPIYLDLLAEDVRAAIGTAHRDAGGALQLLRSQGFVPAAEVDIFDAGPIVECATSQIATVRHARRVTVDRTDGPAGEIPCLIANPTPDFRAVATTAAIDGDHVAIDDATASALEVEPGAQVMIVERNT